MKALTLHHAELTRQALLAKADVIAGAWIGIRIAALLLGLAGWKSTAIAQLFGVSRWAVCQWMNLANEQGLRSVEPQPAPGRKPRLSAAVQAQLDLALQASPEKFGLERTRWDGVSVVEYLRRCHQVELKYARPNVTCGGWGSRCRGPSTATCKPPARAWISSSAQ